MIVKDPQQLLHIIAQIIFDKKGFNIFALDVRNVANMTDFFLVAEGNVERHVSALAKHIIEELKKLGEKPVYVEGLEQGDWIVLDYLEIVIHLFIPQMRDKYRLEELWQEGTIIDVELKKHEKNAAY